MVGYEAPIILKHPDDQHGVLQGGPVTLEIKARGAQPLQYQWYFNNRPIQGVSIIHKCMVCNFWSKVIKNCYEILYTYLKYPVMKKWSSPPLPNKCKFASV